MDLSCHLFWGDGVSVGGSGMDGLGGFLAVWTRRDVLISTDVEVARWDGKPIDTMASNPPIKPQYSLSPDGQKSA